MNGARLAHLGCKSLTRASRSISNTPVLNTFGYDRYIRGHPPTRMAEATALEAATLEAEATEEDDNNSLILGEGPIATMQDAANGETKKDAGEGLSDDEDASLAFVPERDLRSPSPAMQHPPPSPTLRSSCRRKAIGPDEPMPSKPAITFEDLPVATNLKKRHSPNVYIVRISQSNGSTLDHPLLVPALTAAEANHTASQHPSVMALVNGSQASLIFKTVPLADTDELGERIWNSAMNNGLGAPSPLIHPLSVDGRAQSPPVDLTANEPPPVPISFTFGELTSEQRSECDKHEVVAEINPSNVAGSMNAKFSRPDPKALCVERLNPLATMPSRGSSGAAGYDLAYAAESLQETCTIKPGETKLIPTGLSFEFPKGLYGQLFEKSSLSKKMIQVRAGVIDCDYRGEVQVVAFNAGPEAYTFAHGQSVAQLVLLPLTTPTVLETVLTKTARGSGGFGSTGDAPKVTRPLSQPRRQNLRRRTPPTPIALRMATRPSAPPAPEAPMCATTVDALLAEQVAIFENDSVRQDAKLEAAKIATSIFEPSTCGLAATAAPSPPAETPLPRALAATSGVPSGGVEDEEDESSA